MAASDGAPDSPARSSFRELGRAASCGGGRAAGLLRDAGPNVADRTWGEFNTTQIRHPLSDGVPLIGPWLDIPPRRLPGDANMPRVQGPSFVAALRLAVSAGREEAGFFHLPGGQSGHPLSPFYRKGHEALEEGKPTPFLQGPAVHRLRLEPTD